MKKYDIFISYRREGGYDTAKHLYDLLIRDGYRVSFDIDTLRCGDFDTQLLVRIDQCKDFILIVDQHAFDRTLDPNFNPKNDWLRCELAYALNKGKNIIPIFLAGVNGFPNNLPNDVVEVVKKNGPEYNKYHFNAFYNDLKKRFILSNSYKKRIVKFVFVLLSICVVLSVGIIINNRGQIKDNCITESSRLNSEITTNIDNVIMDEKLALANSSPKTELTKHIYETDLTLIEVGDYFYEDRSFSHEFHNEKECIGVVYNRRAPYYANIISLENHGSGNWAVYEKVKEHGVNYSVGGLNWRIPSVDEWVTILRNLADVTCKERKENPNIGSIEFNSKKALKGLNSHHLSFNENGWYWADGEYMSESGEDEFWSLSFINESLYPGTESNPFFRYVADIE